MKKHLHLHCFTAAAILVVIFGTIYVVAQQVQRHDANYPQVQLAEDTASELNQGDQPKDLVKGDVDVANSLAPFTIVYDKSGKVVAGSGQLNGRVPTVPVGVLNASKGKTYHTVTWEPQANVRIASVTVAAKNYYVLSGRSMTEVEKGETLSLQLAFLGGLASLATVGLACLLTHRK